MEERDEEDTSMEAPPTEPREIWVDIWPGPIHPTASKTWKLGCSMWVELCRHAKKPRAPLDEAICAKLGLPSVDPCTWTLGEMITAWPELSVTVLTTLDWKATMGAIYEAMQWRSGALAAGAWPDAIMDDITARIPYVPEVHLPPSEVITQPPLNQELWLVDEPVLAAMATADMAVQKWCLASQAFKVVSTKHLTGEFAVGPNSHPPHLPHTSALARIRALRGHRMHMNDQCPIAEVAKRIKSAILIGACGLDKVAMHMTGTPEALTSTPTIGEASMAAIARLAYLAYCIVPGAQDRWRSLNPQCPVSGSEAVRKLHVDFFTSVSAHLESCGDYLWELIQPRNKGPVPGAQRVMCAELLWYSMGAHIRQDDKCLGAILMRERFVVLYDNFEDAFERLRREPEIPLLMEGPDGLRCVWHGRAWQAPDHSDPWSPVATWMWIMRNTYPGCAGVALDRDCAIHDVDWRLWIQNVGPLFA